MDDTEAPKKTTIFWHPVASRCNSGRAKSYRLTTYLGGRHVTQYQLSR
jgi:hypothetical protein